MVAPTFNYPAMERVHMGTPFDDAIAAEAERAGAKRVFLMLGGTISRETDWAERLERSLSRSGAAVAGRWDRLPTCPLAKSLRAKSVSTRPSESASNW